MYHSKSEGHSVKREIKDALIGIMGMINSVAKKWVDTGMKETPEEMIDFLVPFIFKRKLLVSAQNEALYVL